MEAIIQKIVLDKELLVKEIQHRRGQLGLPPIVFETDNFRSEVIQTIQASPNMSFAKFLAANDTFMAAETKRMRVSPQLGASAQEVERWNKTLNQIFQSMENVERWEEIFKPSFLLKNEAKLYQEILGE